jgi:imidazole glycerol phosphate synthase subunit HisF
MLKVACSLRGLGSLVADGGVNFGWNVVSWSGKSNERGTREIQHNKMNRKGNKEVCE